MTEEKQQKLAGLKRTYSECLARVCSARTDDQITVAARPFAQDLQRLTLADDDVFGLFLEWVRDHYGRRVHPPRMH
jgi:hypothetical protein